LSRNQQLTNTEWTRSFVSGVADTVITTMCVVTRGVFRTAAVILSTLVYICTSL